MDRKPSTKLKHLQPLIAVIVTFVLCIAISIFSLKSGCFIIFQNLFYIPIVISCFYYQKRGFIFSIIVACIYFLLILLFTKESSIILQAIVRVFIFILIAGVITFMSLLRKQMKELRITSLYNRSLIEASLDPLVTLRSDGTIMDVNAATENITGYTHAELIGTEFSKYFTEPEKAEATYQDVFQGGPIRNHLLKLQHRDGHVTSVLFNVSIYRDEQGQYVGVFAAARDITNLIQAEETLRENEKKYRLLADNLHDVIFILDMNLNYTYISPSVRILRGYEPEEVLQQTPAETLTPTSMDLAMKALSEIMELEKSGRREEIPTSRTLQLEMRRKDKTTVMTEVKFSLIRDENQKVVGIMGVTRDITE
jgi:PAS domain S-box-containing protein